MKRRTAITGGLCAAVLISIPFLGATIPGSSDPSIGNASADVLAPMRLEIDISERQLYVHHGGDVATYPVAVGMPEYPTPTGDFEISQVTWNPDWRPPDSEWSEGETYKGPGEEGNPMGRVKMMFDAPDYTIHGTDDLESLGTNASHGSVRLANDVAVRLARRVMAHGGETRSEAWFDEALQNDSDQHIVELSDPVPLSIRP